MGAERGSPLPGKGGGKEGTVSINPGAGERLSPYCP